MSLQDQRVVIIGGSSGMGLATARAAAAQGAAVTIASSDQERVSAALATLPGGCQGVVVNTRNEAGLASLFSRVGNLDHLVCAAGDPMPVRASGEFTLEEARDWFEVRYWGVVAAVTYAAAQIRPGAPWC